MWHRAVTLPPFPPSPLPRLSCSLASVNITKHVFDQCYCEIRDWLSIEAMQGHLVKYHLMANADDMFKAGGTFSPWQQLENVYKKACGMKNGFHGLYLSIRESQHLH